MKVERTATDRLRFDVEVADGGYEIFSWPGEKRIDSENVEGLANGGPIGTGPFGPFLIGIFDNPAAQIDFIGPKTSNGHMRLEYRYRVPLEASNYRIGVGASYRLVAYDGRFEIDPASGRLARILVRTAELPRETGSCEASTTVDLQTARIGLGEYLIPRQSQLRVTGAYGADSESLTTYSACHEFRGESELHFDGSTQAAAAQSAVKAPEERALPPGLPVTVAFDSGIDTEVAAAGDPLTGTLVKDVTDPRSKQVLLPAGTKLNGRIVHLEHHLEGKEFFLVSVQFETLHLMLDSPRPLASQRKNEPCWASPDVYSGPVESKGQLPAGGTFILPSKNGRDVTPAGCQSGWLTVK